MSTNLGRPAPRFLAPDLDPGVPLLRLPADESKHLTRVLRLAGGDAVHVFDGRGVEFAARVVSTGAQVVVELIERVAAAPEPAVRFTIVQAVLKGASMDEVVRDATMIGAACVRPALAARLAVKPALAARAENVERWRRIAVASSKQSRRAVVPEIVAPAVLAEAIAATAPDRRLLFVEPSAASAVRAAIPLREILGAPAADSVALIIGPEGGWTADEIDASVAGGATPVTLGTLTLRAESVALAALAACRVAWD